MNNSLRAHHAVKQAEHMLSTQTTSARVDLHTRETKTHTTLHRYTTSFALNVSEGSNVIVVLDGVKMGALASFNGHDLGEIRSQFLRYTFDVTAFIKPVRVEIPTTVQEKQ